VCAFELYVGTWYFFFTACQVLFSHSRGETWAAHIVRSSRSWLHSCHVCRFTCYALPRCTWLEKVRNNKVMLFSLKWIMRRQDVWLWSGFIWL